MKTVFLCHVIIRRNICLKLQKIDKGDGTLREISGVKSFGFLSLKTLFTTN